MTMLATSLQLSLQILMNFLANIELYEATSYLAISSPRFGGCQIRNGHSNTIPDIAYCALKPSDCTPTTNSLYEYLPPYLIRTTTKCHNPQEVTIGRCTSSLDNRVCSASAESCTIITLFQPKDETCKLLHASDNVDAKTKYPQCRIPSRSGKSSAYRCVLNKDDCVDGEEFLDIGHLPWHNPCHCHQVTTGMCHLKGVSPITADASFCAVGSYDCPEEYSWMSSAQLLNMKDPPRSCVLCREEDIQGVEELHESVVESGGCYLGEYFLHCALESSECIGGETFMSSMQMYKMGHIPCPADDFTGGECTSSLDSVKCTNRAESCELPQNFVARDTCTIHSDKMNGGEDTWFGRCGVYNAYGDGRWCVWSPEECEVGAGDVWYPAKKDQDWLSGCNCEDVQTGACRLDGGGAGGAGYYCAVSKLGCDDPSTYISSKYLLQQIGLDCRLCQKRRVVHMPTQYPTRRPIGSPVSNSSPTKVTAPTKTTDVTEVITTGATVDDQEISGYDLALMLGGALGLMLFITFFATVLYVRKKKDGHDSIDEDFVARSTIQNINLPFNDKDNGNVNIDDDFVAHSTIEYSSIEELFGFRSTINPQFTLKNERLEKKVGWIDIISS